MEKGLKVLLVASESAPFVKSGGLGDVVGSLPKALQNLTFIYNGENREPRFW